MKYIKFFEEISMKDIASVGGKNASLGEMIQALSKKNVLIPSGFAITSDAYKHFLEANNLTSKISDLLSKLDKTHIAALQKVGSEVRALIKKALVPLHIKNEIEAAYKTLEKKYGNNCDIAMRSSATAEDLPQASFAGQQETYLNVSGIQKILELLPSAYASLFTDRAISYRIDQGFDHMDVALSIGIQKMVRSDLASSGVIFTLDTETGFRDVIFITSSYGLGENIVGGSVVPDEFYVHKQTLKQGFKPILKKRLGTKLLRMVYESAGDGRTKNINVPLDEQIRFSLNNEEILTLARYALEIEEHYSALRGSFSPMDIEWAKDGVDGKLYVVQARPETVQVHKTNNNFIQEYSLSDKADKKIILKGKSVGNKIVSGKVRIINSAKDMSQLLKGEVLVTQMTDPDWEPVMKIASGIITDRGGRTCHAAIVSRELGIPAIVGTADATAKLKTGDEVTIDCSSEEGIVYSGILKFDLKKIETSNLPSLKTKIMMNIGNPSEAFKYALLPNDGVGLARLEFIISSAIQLHPMALVHPEKIVDKTDKEIFDRITVEYSDKKQFFIDKLAQEAGTIAAAFYPKPVVIRLSDFKSNEYKKLIAGNVFEPEEENPMIGFRGASRYYDERYKDAFELECKAMLKIKSVMGLNNIIIMVPFVRTISEAQRVLSIMKSLGLERGKDGLKIIMMCEIPSNVILIDEFSKYFDGFSIGSNDLTQMTLAVDRDSSLVAHIFDERDQAVQIMLKMAVEGAKRNGKSVGICGQAPSDYPEIAKNLVKWGIDSISLNPDTILKTYQILGED